jgi:deoxyribodipyrimidine photo-lyase
MRLAPVPPAVSARWPSILAVPKEPDLAALPLDHRVPPVDLRGGSDAAHRTLTRFLDASLGRYGEEGNDPDADVTSHLSPYLHFGHISAHEIFDGVMSHERWTTRRMARGASGARVGWWGVSASAEQFLDQLVVWRELAFNGCVWVPGFERYDTLPAWARKTLEAHLEDPRPHLYELDVLENAATHDPVWNAAQRQLTTEGWFHGYMRMVWGKKILEWSADPAESLLTMEHLMNKYSLDGRDPVSYASFGWVLGRYDRPWFERPVFGTVRCMTTDSARRKLKMKQWLARYGGDTPSLFR